MRLHVEQREGDEAPLGFVFMLPLFALPLGAWALQKGWIAFGTCGLKLLAGIPCLTCGATRATIHLMHGNIEAAFAMQPLVIAAYCALVVWGTVSLASFVLGRSVRISLSSRQDTVLKASLVVLPLLNWFYLIAAGV